jgi:outer membrane putative beta-barrel porin/alpha-amylase
MRRYSAACRAISGVAAVAAACWLGSVEAQDSDETITRARAIDAQDGEPSRGQMSITYQYQRAQDLVLSSRTNPTAPLTTHLIDFAVSYKVGDRWTLSAALPVISREWKGPPSHDPLKINPPQLDSEFVDDGHFHTFFQDLRVGASYRVTSQPILFEPYIEYGVPTSDYPFFAASSVGRNLLTTEVGSTLAYQPPFLKWFFSMRAGYSMADEVLGYSTDAMRVTVDAVYFLNPRLTLNGFLFSKNGKGIDTSVPFDMTSEMWYRHDQITRHNFMNLGFGVNWAVNERSVLNFTTLKMVHAEDVFKLRDALSVSLSRSF